jgi:hypothetical protein
MKKLSKILAIVAILLAPFAASTGVGAASTCQIGYTGPDSNNLCTSVTTYECTVNNNTNIATVTNNGQDAISGGVLVSNNTQSGTGSTGSATNTNGVTFNVTVTNTTGENQNQVCAVVATVPATPVVTPTTPVVTTTKAAPKVLPNTSSNTLTNYIVVLAATLGIGAVASFLFAKVYSRR